METLYREKILQPVSSPYSTELIAGALRPHGEWVATYLSVWVQAYNTRLVKKEELPKTFEDLLDPKWKGRLGIEANIPEWDSTVVLDMGEAKGVRFFRALVRRNGIPVRTGQRFGLIDRAVALDQSDKWAKSFEEVILKRGGR